MDADNAARVVSGVLRLYVPVDRLLLLHHLVLGELREGNLSLKDGHSVLLEMALLMSVHVDSWHVRERVFFVVSVALGLIAHGGAALSAEQLVSRVVRRATDFRLLLNDDWQAS